MWKLIAIIVLSLIWFKIAYDMFNAVLVDDDEKIIDKDPDNDYNNLF
jgi:hypothetical protein